MALSDDYTIVFSGTQATFSDAGWTDIKSNFQKLLDNLHPVTNGVSAKMVYDGTAVNRSSDTVSIKVVVGVGHGEYHSTMGPAWIVPSGGDLGKGYWLMHNGNNVYLYQMDTETGYGSQIAAFGSASWQLGDVLEMFIDDIQATPDIICKRNGTQLGSTAASVLSTYIDNGIPGIVANPDNGEELRGVTEFGFTGSTSGSFFVDDVNGASSSPHRAEKRTGPNSLPTMTRSTTRR